MKKRKQTRRRRDAAQRRGKLGISTVIVVLIAVFLLRGHTMDQRNAAYVEELAQLQNKIDAEEARTQDIADLEAYMQTDEYAEQVAKEKLGLVYEDEIIFKQRELKKKEKGSVISFLSFLSKTFFGGVPPLTKFSGAIRYTESVKAAWKRLCEEAVWGILSLLH